VQLRSGGSTSFMIYGTQTVTPDDVILNHYPNNNFVHLFDLDVV
jgi:hypothetical protein